MKNVTSKNKVAIPDGIYEGLWSGYEIIVIQGEEKSDPIEVNGGVRGLNVNISVEIANGIARIISD